MAWPRRWLARFAALALSVAAAVPSGAGIVQAAPDGRPESEITLTNLQVGFRSTMALVSWEGPTPGEAVAELSESSDFVLSVRVDAANEIAVFTGLAPQTLYFVRVFPKSPDGTAGIPSGTLSFITPPAQYPAPPPVVALVSQTSTSATLSWGDTTIAAAYQIEVSEGLQTLQTVSTKATTATVADLPTDSQLSVRVRALDATGQPSSDWSEPLAVATVSQIPLKIASYNIRCANCKGGPRWSTRRQAVADTILGQLPDVLGLQEASQGNIKGRDISQYMDLLKLLGAPYQATNAAKSASGAVRVFYNTETVELVRQGAHKLPRREGHQQRWVSWAIFTQKQTGEQFFFANTHLEAGKPFGELRKRQAETILETIKAANTDHLPAIIVGDLNSYRWFKDGNKPYDVFVKAGYHDPLGMTYQSRGDNAPGAFVENRINTSFSSFNNFKRKAARLAHLNGTYLDYILVNPKLRVSEWETVVNVDSKGDFIGVIPSDHNLVRATIWLP